MLIGAMNHPAHDVLSEIEWMAEVDLDFIDLTIEPPMASVDKIDVRAIRSALDEHGLQIVGHTAYYLPLCSPFEGIRRACVDELKRCIHAFAALGVQWMNLHPDRIAPMHDRKFIIEKNLQSLRDLFGEAHRCGVGLMIENLPGNFNTVMQLSELMDPLPELGLHLDIGHANLMTDRNTTGDLLTAYGSRLRHVHLHDNKGGSADLHLPLGAGTIEVAHYIHMLQATGYDGTITLEVFSPDRHHFAYSRDVLRRIWDEGTHAKNGFADHDLAPAEK
ncbi:MAG TPA: sugar phosphate isomerase/epimerase family protein [Verrucomicrobiae bacterium]|jgi:sugar phosphate isomerase/epimerase|nr:sugar phosphate isomerase/epimerase family protein [Verrucomicrobiae bacterium]